MAESKPNTPASSEAPKVSAAKPKAQGSAPLTLEDIARLAEISVDEVMAFRDRGGHLSVVTTAGQKLRIETADFPS